MLPLNDISDSENPHRIDKSPNFRVLQLNACAEKQKNGGRDDDEGDEDEGTSANSVAEDTPRGKKAAKVGKGKGGGASPSLPSGEILDVVRTAEEQMEAALDALQRELSKLRTGRASAGAKSPRRISKNYHS